MGLRAWGLGILTLGFRVCGFSEFWVLGFVLNLDLGPYRERLKCEGIRVAVFGLTRCFSSGFVGLTMRSG